MKSRLFTLLAFFASITAPAQEVNGSDPIDFADAKVKEICVANWDTNGDGELSYDEAAAVTELGKAFQGNEEITSFEELRFFTGLTSIGDRAFEDCYYLTSIQIPESVTKIGEVAFDGCRSLTSINIPESVTSIGNSAFFFCSSLTSINIPESVTSIGDGSFDHCYSLTSIHIPESVTSIGERVFDSCSSLSSINIPESVTSIGNYAFSECSSLTSIHIPESVTSIGYGAFAGCFGLTSINIPESVTSIGGAAFSKCSSLSSIHIPESVTSIGNYAFSYCGLTSINIPESVTSIGDGSFDHCGSLTSITIPESVTSIGNYAFYGCGLTSINIPESVTSIGKSAFAYCSSLTSIHIPESFTSIGERVFENCSSLSSINIPESVTSIGDYAFYGCTSLTSINIPESVTSIGEYAFYRCNLTSIDIPESVTSIGDVVFGDCPGLTSITVATNNPVYDSRNDCNAVIETASNTIIAGCQNTVIPESVTSIGDHAFDGCHCLTSINIPESVTSIGEAAFGYCSSLTSIHIPESFTSIGSGAFFNCRSLTSINIPESVTSILAHAFEGCSNLTSVTSYIKNPFTIESNVFEGINPSCILYVPAGTKALYEQTDGWHEHFSEIREMGDITDFVTYTIGVDGHGEVVIGNNVIDDGEEETAIEVAKGHQVVVTLQPEEGYRLNKLTVGDVDVTEQVMNNMFVIQSAATDTTLYAIFTEDIEDFVANGIHYGVIKGTENVKVLPYKYEDEVRIPETVDYGGTRWTVTGLSDNAFANNSWLYYVSVPRSVNQVGEELFKRCTRLAALSWNPEQTPITRQMVNGRVKNRNMLWFVKDRALFQVPLIGNLVVNGTAEQVVLVDDGSEHGFYNPQDFTAMNIQYTHNYQLETSKGKTMGWETISLPFDVDEYYSATQTAPAYPFATVTGDEVEAGKRPFWLYSYDETSDDFKPATAIEANTPYIISMPNSDFYESIYMLAGNVVFRTQREVTVKASDNLNVATGSERAFYPCFQTPYMPDAMGINLQGEGYSEKGSIFMISGRLYDDIQPFAAYFRYVDGSSKEFFHIFEGMTDGINDMEIPEKVRVKDGNDIYDLAGRRIQRPTRRGIYIVGGRKQVVK